MLEHNFQNQKIWNLTWWNAVWVRYMLSKLMLASMWSMQWEQSGIHIEVCGISGSAFYKKKNK